MKRKALGVLRPEEQLLERLKSSIPAADIFRAELPGTRHWRKLGHDYYARIYQGETAIVDIPNHDQYTNRVKIQALFVPENQGGNGIGTRALLDMLELVDWINGEIKAERKYENKTIRDKHFSALLMPVPFYADWNSGSDCTNMEDWQDDAIGNMDEDKIRMDWKQLEKWYLDNGFVRCNYCANEFGPGTITNRSRDMGRIPLIYPQSHLIHYDK